MNFLCEIFAWGETYIMKFINKSLLSKNVLTETIFGIEFRHRFIKAVY